MKKIEQISLNGIVFHVEEDAYAKLRQYILSLEKYYDGKESGKEIVDDIQTRFAELLSEKKQFPEQAITLTHIEEVIAVLGYPENFESESDESPKQPNTSFTKRSKRLYRDPENARIAGVCSGLAYYFGGEAWLYRGLFIILGLFSFGTWAFIYIILWFIIPKAETTAQRYEMKGESLNVDGIEQKIKTEITDAGDRIKKFADNNSDKFKNTARTAKDVFAFIGKILGLGMILFAVFSIIIVLISWFFPVSSIFVAHPTLNIFCINEMFKFWGISQTASILCMIWSLLPLAGLLLLGIALFLSKMGKKISVFLLSLLGLWIVLSIFLGIGLSSIIAEKKLNAYNETTEMPISSTAQTLLIKPSPTSQFIGKSKTLFGHFLFMNMDQKNRLVYGIPEVWVTSENWVTSSDVTQAFIRVSKRNFQNDYTYKSFNIDIQDSVIYIPTVFGFKNNIWNGERINVEIIVPKGKQVIFDKEFTINDLSGYHYCNDDWD